MSRNWYKDRFIPHEGGVRVECAVCSKPFWLPKSKAHLYVTCCSECAKTKRELETEYRKRTCKVCGKEFKPRSVQLNGGAGIYCSHKCHGIANRGENNPQYGKQITVEQKKKWRETTDKNNSLQVGEKNKRWKGGQKAKTERDKANGWPSQQARRAKTNKKLPNGFIHNLKKIQKERCAICRCSIKSLHHVDHIMPLALGGEHEPHNIQLLCPICNLRKGKAHPVEFMQRSGYLL